MCTRNVLCCSCSQNLNDSKDIYAIIKCGHTYHEECLKKIIYKRTCTICHINYNPRQCTKLNIFSKNDKDYLTTFKYDWMYFDETTDLKENELSECLLKLGTDHNNNKKNIYAARIFHKNHILPAYFIPPKSAIAIYDDHVYDVGEDMELLDISSDDIDFYKWMKCTNDKVPRNSLDITKLSNEILYVDIDLNGSANGEEKQYIARGEYEGKMLYGKLCSNDNSENNCVYLANGKQVIKCQNISDFNCEVLVRNT